MVFFPLYLFLLLLFYSAMTFFRKFYILSQTPLVFSITVLALTKTTQFSANSCRWHPFFPEANLICSPPTIKKLLCTFMTFSFFVLYRFCFLIVKENIHIPDVVTFPPTSLTIAAYEKLFSRNTTMSDLFSDQSPFFLYTLFYLFLHHQ